MSVFEKRFHLFILFLFILVYSNYLFFVGFGPGDGFGDYLFVKNSNLGLLDNFKTRISELNSYSRPVSLFLNILIHSLFGEHFILYTFANILTWYLTIYTIYFCLKFFLIEKIARYFLLIGLFPFYSSSIFYEPYLFTAYNVSILTWSISLYFSLKFSLNFKIYFKILSLIFFIISLLTLEIILPLIVFSILLPYCLRNSVEKKNVIFDFKNIIIFCLPVLLISILFLIYKLILVNLIFFNDQVYGYREIDLKSMLQGIYYFFSLFVELPILLIKSIFYLNFPEIILIIFIVYFLNNYFFSEKLNFKFLDKINKNSKNIFYLTLFFSLITNCLVFTISSYPAVTYGFYNKMMVCSFIVFSILISLFLTNKKTFMNKIISFALILLCISSLHIQITNFTKSSVLRSEIVSKIKKELNKIKLDKKLILFANVPHYLNNNYNNESVFFTKWHLKSNLEFYNIDNLKNVNLVSYRHLNDKYYNPSHNVLFKLNDFGEDEFYYYFEIEEDLNSYKFLNLKNKKEMISFFEQKKKNNINNHPVILREKIRLKLKKIFQNILNI